MTGKSAPKEKSNNAIRNNKKHLRVNRGCETKRSTPDRSGTICLNHIRSCSG